MSGGVSMKYSIERGLKRVCPLARLFSTAAVAAVVFLNLSGCSGSREDHTKHEQEVSAVYACPMLCVPPTDKPGKCPVCGMELERVQETSTDTPDQPVISMSERSSILSKVETALVERREVSVSVRLNGKVVPDERKVFHIAARVPGRIEKIAADYTGMTLKQNDPLLTLYSPVLLSAQEELLQTKRSGDRTNLTASEDKLRLLGITREQTENLLKTGKASDLMTFVSPVNGTVISKDAVEGAYVKGGTKLYTIADLTTVWIVLDAYESDLPFLRTGQEAVFSTEAEPGTEYKSSISFIEPSLNEMTRTVPVRLEAENADSALKPGMFVRATVSAAVNARGKPAAASEAAADKPIVIPASAPLITGKRAIVYIANGAEGEYEGREVILGPRAGDHYVVLNGLSEGDRIVVRGSFRIDSALQIMGRPSMMTPAGTELTPVEKMNHEH